MFFLEKLFGRNKSVEDAPSPETSPPPTAQAVGGEQAPGTSIRFDPLLVGQLLEDHQSILAVFGAISAAAQQRDFARVEVELQQFRTHLTDHLFKENVRLYVYLEHMLAADPTSHQLMHGFRHEMDQIGRAVVGFLQKYQGIASNTALHDGFAGDLAQIGAALQARVQREEATLYPMYQAP